MVPQSRPSEDGEVNKHRARPNALDPTTSFRPNEQTDQFSPNDIITRNAAVRPDGRVMNDLYVVQVKAPREITDPLDNLQVLAKLGADELYPGPAQSACPLFRQQSGSR